MVPSNFVADEGDRFAVDIKQGGNEVIWMICGIEDIKDLRGGAAGEACYAWNYTVFCTHGLGNPNYPGYRTHYEQAGYSVSHYLVVVGYDTSDNFILNDPGLTKGKGYHIKFDQLVHAIDDLDQAYPSLNSGRVFVVLAPFAPTN